MKQAVIVCGVAASGKSTYASIFVKHGFKHLERDIVRTEYFGLKDWKDWDWTKEYEVTLKWESLFQSITDVGENIIISDTLVKRSDRDKLVKRLKEKGYDVILTILNPSLETILDRNSKRGGRAVDEDVIRKMYDTLNKDWV